MTDLPIRCIDPGAATDDDLLAYARDEADPAIGGHIERCPACRERSSGYAVIERVLRAVLFRRTCPDTTVIGEYALDVLPAETRRTVAEHLLECSHCREESRGFRAFLAEPDLPVQAAGPVGMLRRVFARPFTPPAPALAGLRGAGEGDSVTYTAESVCLTLSVQRAGRPGGGSIVVGLLEQEPAEEGIVAALYRGDALLQSEEVDDLGNFMFSGVSAGDYRVEINLPPITVVVEPVQVP